MACYHPIDCWKIPSGESKTGYRLFFGSPSCAPCFGAIPCRIPCGKCIGCRLARSRQWAVRCVHEASLHDANAFVTLTYSPEYLPSDGCLSVDVLQRFFKRLRKALSGVKLRYFACGEYGEMYNRPHYHFILFGYDFRDDRVLLRNTPYGALYISPLLSRVWPYGFSSIGSVTFHSAAYVARYVTKKRLGKDASSFYLEKGLTPEFVTMSRRPGIAHDWIVKHYPDVYNYDKIVLADGMITRPPKYYDSFFELTFPEDYAIIKETREKNVSLVSAKRLLDMEQVQLEKARKLIRPIELEEKS